VRLRRVARFAYGDSLAERDDGDIAVYGSNGCVGSHVVPNTTGPVLVVGRKGSFGKVQYSEAPVFAIDTTFFVDARHTNANLRWLYYVLLTLRLDDLSEDVGVPGLSREKAYEERISLPSPTQQAAIADYLDRETARIDALIAAKRRMVTLSEERRAATIARSVTPALSATTRWHRVRLRHVLVRMIDTEHKTAPFYDDGGFLVIRTNNVSCGRLVVGPSSRFTDAAGYQEWTRRGRPEPGDILFTREAPAGEACLVPDGLKGCVGQRTVLFKVDENHIVPRYLLWALYGGVARSFIDELSQGTTLPHLNMSDIADIPLWVPDLKAQQAIADQLDETTKTIDEVVAVIEQQLALLNEHRQALITAAVTGQLDIAEAA